MNGLKLEIYQWLLELGDDKSAIFLKSCEVDNVFVDYAIGMSDDRDTQINDVIIRLPLRKYKAIGEFTTQVDAIESAIRESAESQGVYARDIEWLPMLSNDRISEVNSETLIDHHFINEQISKCQRKIQDGDYNGAVTNARSLIEAVCIEIIEKVDGNEIKNDGNIENLWARTKKIMRLNSVKGEMPDTVIQILSGIDTAVKGLAGLSNSAGDRHANKFRTQKHHARLAVNLSLTIADFLFESFEYQKHRGQI